jgi:hypothetical protein
MDTVIAPVSNTFVRVFLETSHQFSHSGPDVASVKDTCSKSARKAGREEWEISQEQSCTAFPDGSENASKFTHPTTRKDG